MSLRQSFLFGLACAVGFLFMRAPDASAQTAAVPDILLDGAESTSGWRSQSTLSRDTQIKVHGASSLKAVGSRKDQFRKVLSTPIDVSRMRYLTFWYYIDKPELQGTVGGTFGQVEISSSGTYDEQERNWPVVSLHLQRGWNFVVLDLPGNHRGNAGIDFRRVNYFRIYHDTKGTITTRIDDVRFTNRDPASSAFAEYLRGKRIAASATAVAQEDYDFRFVDTTQPGSTKRARYCRSLRLDLMHREVNALTLQSMGVTAAATTNEIRERTFFKEYICGERVMSRNELTARLQSRAAKDIAIVQELATLFDLTFAAAAETKDQLLETDLNRILAACGGTDAQIDAYIQRGTLPSPMTGSTILTRNCSGGAAAVSVVLGGRSPVVSNRRTAYQQCMKAFTSQAAECDNPYARTADEAYSARLWEAARSVPERDDAWQRMQRFIENIDSIEVNDARALVGGTFATPGRPDTAYLDDVHEEYDRGRAQVELIDEEIYNLRTNYEESDIGPTPGPELQIRSADLMRLEAEKRQREAETQDRLDEICFHNPNDSICPQPPAGPAPAPEPSPPEPGQAERCANMQFEDGSSAWFDNPASSRGNPGQGFPSQVNEADRINHCLCKLLDRSYSSILPGDPTLAESGCPTPEERAAQNCLENPSDGRDGIRRECRHLMQPISMDRDALNGKMCEKILPNCQFTYLKDDNSCGCATVLTNGNLNLPGCRNGVPNCPEDTIPTVTGCGCVSTLTGAGECTRGGKDFYLTQDPLRDLSVRVYPNEVNFPEEHILLAREGDTRIVTAGMKRSEVFDPSRLWLTTVLPGASYDGTGQIKVSCSNPATGVLNHPVETILMSQLATDMPTMVPINLSSSERAACFGTNPDNRTHFEIFVDSKVGQPVGFFDILDGFGNVKPPCVDFPPRPAPGPRPLSAWPSLWKFSDGLTIAPKFNGVGPMPTPGEPPPPPGPLFPVCVGPDGILIACP